MKKCVHFVALTFSLISTSLVQAQWVQTNGPYGGQINSLVSIGSDIFTIAGGAVLHSTNNGTSWNATGLTNGGVVSIVSEGNKLIAIGSEIYVSIDEGVHWNVTGSNLPWTNVDMLAASNTTLFESADDGLVSHLTYSLYRSTDDGASWTPDSNGLANAGLNAIAFNGDANIYVGTNSGVYVSTNNGGTWKSAGLEKMHTSSVIVASNGSGGTNIFAATRNGVFRSTNEGANWSSVNSGLSDTVVTALSIYENGTGTPTILAGTQGGRVFLSSDNGDGWTEASNGLITGPWEWGDWEADVRSLTVVGSNFFACTNAGLYLSTNNGSSWGPADDGIINSLTINALAVYSSETGSSIFAGSFPSGVFLSTDNGSHWGAVNNGINSIDINAFTISGKNIFAGGPTGVFLSTNNGTSWNTVGLSNTGEVVCLSSLKDAKGDTLILAGTWSGLFISKDNGRTWDSTGLKVDVQALAWRANGQGGEDIFAGTRGGGIFLSTDNGVTWTSLNNGIPVVVNISAFVWEGKNLFAATDYILYVSTDNGASWSPTGLNTSTISSNTYICSLAIDTNGTNGLIVFAGTNDDGVLVSKDGGATWAAANAGLTDMCIYSLAVSGSYLFAGTNISGVWRRPLSELTAIYEQSAGNGPRVFSLNQNYPNPFNPSTTIRYQIPEESRVTITIYNTLGQNIATLVDEQKRAGSYSVEWNAPNVPSGVYFYRADAVSASDPGKRFVDVKKMILLK